MIPETWTLFDLSHGQWTLLLVAVTVVGFSKTGVAGVGILNPVLFAMIFPASQSVGILLPLLIMADFFAVGNYRKHAQWGYVWRSLPWVGIGIGAGYMFMRHFAEQARFDAIMKICIGAIVLSMMALSFWLSRKQSKNPDFKSPTWLTPFFGLLAGFSTMLANAAGPIFSIYLLTYGLPKREFMGTRAMAFFIINWVKVPLMAERGLITWESLSFNACLFPAIALGAWIGVKSLRHIPERIFKRAIQVLVLAACTKMIWSGVFPRRQRAPTPELQRHTTPDSLQ